MERVLVQILKGHPPGEVSDYPSQNSEQDEGLTSSKEPQIMDDFVSVSADESRKAGGGCGVCVTVYVCKSGIVTSVHKQPNGEFT
jgi:hypothetical protein